MNLGLSMEQEDFRESVRGFLEARYGLAHTRAAVEADGAGAARLDRAVWSEAAEQVGLQGLHVPERWEGFGFGPVELALVFEEAGRVLISAPLQSSAVAASVLLAGAEESARDRWLPGICRGSVVAAVAGLAPAGAGAFGDPDGLDGTVEGVFDAADADLVILPVGEGDGLELIAVELDQAGADLDPASSLDPSRPYCTLRLSGAEGTSIAAGAATEGALAAGFRTASLTIAAEGVGAAAAIMELTAEYAGERRQFGRPIGQFQGVKHRLADIKAEQMAVRALLYDAARALEEESDRSDLLLATLRSAASELFLDAAQAGIHLHGGVGFTWEHDAHLFYRRAQATRALYGGPERARRRVGELAGLV